MTSRVAIFGDVQGHLEPFVDGLATVAVTTSTAPEDLTVVLVGDLIHKGPDSDGVLRVVAELAEVLGDRLIVLVGNHEAHHLGGPRFWGHEVTGGGVQLLRHWWETGFLKVSAAVSSVELGPVLVTHAGVVRDLWVTLDRPETPDAAVAALAELRSDVERLFAAGMMLRPASGQVPGPVWAAAGPELYDPWLDAPTVPFSQVHGHSQVYLFDRDRPRRDTSSRVVERLQVDREARQVTFTAGDRTFVGVDPSIGPYPSRPIRPLLLTGTVTTCR